MVGVRTDSVTSLCRYGLIDLLFAIMMVLIALGYRKQQQAGAKTRKMAQKYRMKGSISCCLLVKAPLKSSTAAN